MQYREYGQTGIAISTLGFGAGRFPHSKRDFDMDHAVAVLRRAFDLGVNYVDTAEVYCFGLSEIAVGKAVKGRRSDVLIASKYSFVEKHQPAAEWREHLEGSLKRLDVDCIDFYHLHDLRWTDYRKLQAPGTQVDEFMRARDEGLIGHLCFSSHDQPDNIARLIDSGEFAGMLVIYNLLDRKNEEVIAHAHARGMGVAIMEPVAAGVLAEPSRPLMDMLPGATGVPDLALRFVLANPNVTTAVSGMTATTEVEANVASASREEPLSERQRHLLFSALAEVQGQADDYCNGCGKCAPCSEGVDIPANLGAMRYLVFWGLEQHARAQYTDLGKETRQRTGSSVRKWAESCTGCAECEPRCPLNVPIVERLRETAAALGGG